MSCVDVTAPLGTLYVSGHRDHWELEKSFSPFSCVIAQGEYFSLGTELFNKKSAGQCGNNFK